MNFTHDRYGNDTTTPLVGSQPLIGLAQNPATTTHHDPRKNLEHSFARKKRDGSKKAGKKTPKRARKDSSGGYPRGTGPRTPGSAYPDSGETKAHSHRPRDGCSFWFRSRNHPTQGERRNPTESPQGSDHSRLLPQLPAVAAGRTSRYLRTTFWAIA